MVCSLNLRMDGAGSVDLIINGKWKEVIRSETQTIYSVSTNEIPNFSFITLRAVPDPGYKVSVWHNIHTKIDAPRGQATIAFAVGAGLSYSFMVMFVIDPAYVPVIPVVKPPVIPPVVPPVILPVVPPAVLPTGSFAVGTCTVKPSKYQFAGFPSWDVLDKTGRELYTGNTLETAKNKAASDPACRVGYIPPLPPLPPEPPKPPVPPEEEEEEEEDYSKIIIVAGVGLLAIVAIYLSRRKK